MSTEWKLVPVEPTEEMKAACTDDDQGAKGLRQRMAAECYKAMLAAAPQSPAIGGEPDFWVWLDKAYRDGSKGEHAHFTKYNMEVAYSAGRAPLLAEIERLKVSEDKWYCAAVDLVVERDTLEARCEELEGLLRTQGGHLSRLAENTFGYSSGIGSLIKTKEINDAVYAALAHKQLVNAALAAPAAKDGAQ